MKIINNQNQKIQEKMGVALPFSYFLINQKIGVLLDFFIFYFQIFLLLLFCYGTGPISIGGDVAYKPCGGIPMCI